MTNQTCASSRLVVAADASQDDVATVEPLTECLEALGRGDPVRDRYARIMFNRTLVPGKPGAGLVMPGQPLLDDVLDVVLERVQSLIQQDAVLFDDADAGPAPLFTERHALDGA